VEYKENKYSPTIVIGGAKMMNYPKVKSVKPLDDLKLYVTFTDDKKKIYDVKPLLDEYDVFQSLVTIKYLFNQVKVDTGGYAIVWNDEIDLACEDLYDRGVDVEQA
jgi:hypothetical protein